MSGSDLLIDDLADLEVLDDFDDFDGQPSSGAPTAEDIVEFGMSSVEFAASMISRASAEQMAAIRSALRDAQRYREVFVPDPTAADAASFARRAATLDIAARLRMSENTVSALAGCAETLITRTPSVWAAFCDGEVPVANARITAEVAASLPDDRDLWAAFDERVAPLSTTLNPPRYRSRIRTIRERIHTRATTERHAEAHQGRRIVIEHGDDGMSWFSLFASADQVERIRLGIEQRTKQLAAAPDEQRTRDQICADVAADLLAGIGTAPTVGVSLGVIVPFQTLLGEDRPAVLEGYGPIDAETARKLTAEAPSMYRILTDPVTGTVLDVDRKTRHIPADLKRWLRLRYSHCAAPGCGRRDCDIDHTLPLEFGGPTSGENLDPLCEPHHRVRHRTRWRLERRDATLAWTSPTGRSYEVDPPPPF
jgi:hypothetical protein